MGTGKDMRTISNNFMAIARKIKTAEYRLLRDFQGRVNAPPPACGTQ